MLSNFLYDAKADIKGSTIYPDIKGSVYFKQTKKGVIVTVELTGLPQSNNNCKGKFFAFHIHNGTSCTGNVEDEFANAGVHLNPNNCDHPYHIGDLPPIIENNGYAYMNVLIGKFQIKDIIGKAIIVHDMPDDFTTQPSGNSGKKIACGIIK